MTRRFSIPYGNSEPYYYLESIEKYYDNIDSIYLGFPGIEDHSQSHLDFIEKYKNTTKFLELSSDKYKRILTLNRCFINKPDHDKTAYLVNTVIPILVKFKIDGVIISDYNLARILRGLISNIEIQTSCNTYQFLNKTYEYWNKYVGISVFNPPREYLRTSHLLNEVKKLGIKVKAIVNENCIYGCPQNINHACYISTDIHDVEVFCNCKSWRYSDILRGNFILPRQLKLFDEYVDIYKIAGRGSPVSKIFHMIDAYVNERNDVNLIDITTSRNSKKFKSKNITIPVNRIPDKLLTCECTDCESCQICEKVMLKCIRDSEVDLNSLEYSI